MKRWIATRRAEWPDSLSGEIQTAQPDPAALGIENALRKGDPNFRKLVLADPTSVNRKGLRGDTPMHYAALYGTADDVQFLLDHGADPNVANDAGAAPLMYSVNNLEKTRLLLEHKANPNAHTSARPHRAVLGCHAIQIQGGS